MKLSEWAKLQGISYKTAWRWFKEGKLPVPVEQTATGTILVKLPDSNEGLVAVYARVSSADQKPDLDRQIARLSARVTALGFPVGYIWFAYCIAIARIESAIKALSHALYRH